ncbi:RNA-directed DNA polymerase [Abditibacterium utsteinense]|uniref:RNA-directed DNA polymerase n=1 Tax=Abditibacterium utsteinense TaxID=1960156 RepID=A0A2S8SS89_9BACT|nr:reverse transcriptase domain-containing protein [Abditibacterium utsteinense]PQV63682.1 RNA-directed DNA polymerase [Abditibacterium utsteinense]
MSEETTEIPADWRARIKEQGKEAFQLDELRRLGFWPPSAGLQEQVARAEEEVKRLDREMAPLRAQLRKIEGDISRAADVQSALDEIRKARIGRVKAAREAKKIARAMEKIDRETLWKEKRASDPQFLGRGVSVGLQFEGGDLEKLTKNEVPQLQTTAEIALAIGIETRELTWLCYHRGASTIDHYHRFQIPKKRGGMRNVSAPKTKLRRAQRFVLEQILANLPVHEAAMAFCTGVSTLDNARKHAGKRIVARLDLKDFFPSIDFSRVKRFFQSLGYNEGCATIFALLCTEAPRAQISLDGQRRYVAIGERRLPQGACTSPALSNLLCRRLDARLSGLAGKRGFKYTRYADDLVFSSDEARPDIGALLVLSQKIVEDEKFVVNSEKTLVMKTQNRQSVTGLVVNAQSRATPRVSRDDLRRFRAFLHGFETLGREAMTEKLGQDALFYARGYLAYIAMSDPLRAGKLRVMHPFLARD